MRTKDELLKAIRNCKQGESVELSIGEFKLLLQENIFDGNVTGLRDLFEKSDVQDGVFELVKEDNDLSPNRVLH